MARTNYTPEFKSKLVLQGEKELNGIAAEHNINPNMLRNWKKDFLANAIRAYVQLYNTVRPHQALKNCTPEAMYYASFPVQNADLDGLRRAGQAPCGEAVARIVSSISFTIHYLKEVLTRGPL